MKIEFKGKIFYWKGPAPFYFVTIPEEYSLQIKDISKMVTYGWGVIPVSIRIGETEFKTSLFPKDGKYLVPVKKIVRDAEDIKESDEIFVQMGIQLY
jgi:hypothetical protein